MSDFEKNRLLVDEKAAGDDPDFVKKAPIKRPWIKSAILFIWGLTALASLSWQQLDGGIASRRSVEQYCPIQHDLKPREDTEAEKLLSHIRSKTYYNQSLSLLSDAVRIDTQISDDAGTVANDPRFEKFAKFSKYLDEAFPVVHSKLHLEKVNTYGRLYTWQGTDQSLKPLVLMAHQDTVPIGRSEDWTFPPLSATLKDGYLYGRGVSDCKNLLVGLLEAAEQLLQADYIPRRTILLSFGFDEELVRHNNEGAGHLARRIEEIYGYMGVEAIVDEGGNGILSEKDSEMSFALPSTGEKGYVDLHVVVRTLGGHSSVPPKHTGIGIMAQIATALESHVLKPTLSYQNPGFASLACFFKHEPNLPKGLKRLISKAAKSAKDLAKLAQSEFIDYRYKAIFRTTQALDVINGGVKSNALPESTTLVINYRIALEDSLEALYDRIDKIVRPIAEKHSLHYIGLDSSLNQSSEKTGVSVRAVNSLPVAPISPANSNAFRLFSGAIRHVFGNNTIVAPSIVRAIFKNLFKELGNKMSGNTDCSADLVPATNTYADAITEDYYRLSRNVYRFIPSPIGASLDIHAVDERLHFPSHVKLVEYAFQLMRVFGDNV